MYIGVAGMFGVTLNMIYFIIQASTNNGKVTVYFNKYGEMNIEIIALILVAVCGLYAIIKVFGIVNCEIKIKKKCQNESSNLR